MRTVLKHEIIRTRAMLGLAVGVALLLAIAGTALAATGWPILAELGLVLLLGVALGLLPACQLLLAVDYWRSSYGRTGYLTQTLPLPGPTLYWGKIVWAWLVSVATTLVSVGIAVAGSGVLSLRDGSTRESPATVLREAWTALTDVTSGWGVAAIAVLALTYVLMAPTQYFFAGSVGSQAPMNRLGVGGPVLVWLGLYVAVQVLTLASFAVVPLGVGLTDGRLSLVPFHLFAELPADSAGVMPIGFVPTLLLVSVACVVWTVRSWKRRVSLV